MGTLQGSWVWYELMTPDPEGAKAFYDKVIGWNIQTSHGNDADYGFIVNTDGGMTGGILRLTQEMTDGGAHPCWIGYIGVDDVDTALVAIEAAGGKTMMAARNVEMAGRIAMVADPGGAPFYVMTPTPPPGGGESTCFSATPLMGRCGWNELMAGDAARDTAFYQQQFGWTLAGDMDMGPMGKYQFIAHDDVTIGAIMPKPEMVPQPHWGHYFWVSSIPDAKAAIEANGGTVTNGPMEVPGPLWIVQGIDPQGAHFALVGEK